MMKTNFKLLATFLLSIVVLASCVQDDDFDIPNTAPQEVNLDGQVIGIGAVQADFVQAQDFFYNEDTFNFFTYDDESDDTATYMEGYVISSDEGGNFFEEIILQDKAENPTVGIKLLIDVNPLFTSYEFGRKVFIRLDGLSVGLDSGVLTLGVQDGDRIGKIAPSLQSQVIVRSTETAEIVPLVKTISEIKADVDEDDAYANQYLNLYLSVPSVQFTQDDVNNGITYAGETSDEFDGERILQECNEAGTDVTNSIIFSTSTFADFKGLTLPSGSGSIDGILSLNFFGEDYIINVNSPETVNLTGERCDPPTPFFTQNFEGASIEDLVANEGWTNQNVSGGSVDWFSSSFNDNTYARISAFNSGQAEADVYLVTPAINLDATENETLRFDLEIAFDNGNILSVLISTDFTGDASTATWTDLNANIPDGPGSGFGGFQSIPAVDLSGYDGDVYIAFFYEGTDSETTRYHVDNISVAGE
ncbi:MULTISPECIES: DUF5689 domain-containing protein [Croceibacter]|nr:MULTISPECIES: DUF5689 domain-containing protein [Croceibacter]MBW4970148.1 choice-of-anchor J domain-containing protein [Croceibacter atlanticus]